MPLLEQGNMCFTDLLRRCHRVSEAESSWISHPTHQSLEAIVALKLESMAGNFGGKHVTWIQPNIAIKMSLEHVDARNIYEFTVKTIDGEDISLEIYKGLVLLIVNVASRCGFTAMNYKDLVKLDALYRERGLRILAFPCNQFHQEPGDKEEIICFARKKDAKFDFFDKIDVNGKNAHPLYKYLKTVQRGTLTSAIKWNFTKFIVDRTGKPVERHAPYVPPMNLCTNIETYLELSPRESKKSTDSKSSEKRNEKKEPEKKPEHGKKWKHEKKGAHDDNEKKEPYHNTKNNYEVLMPG